MEEPKKISVTICLYGAFRKYADGHNLCVSAPTGAKVGDLRRILETELLGRYPNFNDFGLVEDSAFADEGSLIDDERLLSDGENIAVLPPVCGG